MIPSSRIKCCPLFVERTGFTLVELLVTITVIGMLCGLLLPALQAARASARRVSCSNKMRQIGIAIHQYVEIHSVFPPSKFEYEVPDTNNTIKHNIIPYLLPYIEHVQTYEQYDFDKNWQNAANKTARQTSISLLLCPEAPQERWCRYSTTNQTIVEYFCSDYTSCDQIASSVYKKLITSGTIRQRSDWRSILRANWDGMITPEAVGDGLSNSMMFFECSGRPKKYGMDKVHGDPEVTPKEPMSGAEWADARSQIWLHDPCGGGMQLMNCTNQNEIYSFHRGGSNFLYGDAAVQFHSETIHPDVFISLFTAHAGD
jgi:prepilin-type N-terminal cleavage/methylation domain-containing protein